MPLEKGTGTSSAPPPPCTPSPSLSVLPAPRPPRSLLRVLPAPSRSSLISPIGRCGIKEKEGQQAKNGQRNRWQ